MTDSARVHARAQSSTAPTTPPSAPSTADPANRSEDEAAPTAAADPHSFLRSSLASNPLFRRVDSPEIRTTLLSAFRRDHFGQGDLIVQYGARGDRFYILETGQAAVEIPDTQPTRTAQVDHEAAAAAAAAATVAQQQEQDQAQQRGSDAPPLPSAHGIAAAAAVTGSAPVIVSSAVTSDMVRVDLIERGSSFGEISVLYDVPRCASIRCLTAGGCDVWSIDARTFREHSKAGSSALRRIFQTYASVRVEDTQQTSRSRDADNKHAHRKARGGELAAAAAESVLTSPIAAAPAAADPVDDDDVDRKYMTQLDFVQAIEHSKGENMWCDDAVESSGVTSSQSQKSSWLSSLWTAVTPASWTTPAAANPYANLTPHRLRLIFRLADSSGDGLLSFGEFLILHSLLSQPHTELQLAFRLFDRNKNGFVERGEFIAAIRALAEDRGERIDFNHDTLVQELFGPPIRRRRTDVEREALRAQRAQRRQQQTQADASLGTGEATSTSLGAGGGAPNDDGRVRTLWHDIKGRLFHERGTLVQPTAAEPAAPSGDSRGRDSDSSTTTPSLPGHEILADLDGDDDGDDEFVTEYRALSYAHFESLLRRDILPAYLRSIQRDLRAIDRFWEGDRAPFSLASMEDGFGSSINLEAVQDNLPQVTAAHVADTEKLLVGKVTSGASSAVPWKSLVAGGIAGAVSRSIVAPLERLKMLFQTQALSNKADDAAANKAGSAAAGSKAEGGGKQQSGSSQQKQSRRARSGGRYQGVQQGLRQIYAEDGARGFWRGNLANILRVVPVVGLQFFFYDLFKTHLFGPWRNPESVVQRLVAGSAAGVVACVITYPLDTVRARLTLQRGASPAGIAASVPAAAVAAAAAAPAAGGSASAATPTSASSSSAATAAAAIARPYRSIPDAFRSIWLLEGYRGFYHGLVPSMVGVLPYVGFDFAVYETLKRKLPRDEHQQCTSLRVGPSRGRWDRPSRIRSTRCEGECECDNTARVSDADAVRMSCERTLSLLSAFSHNFCALCCCCSQASVRLGRFRRLKLQLQLPSWHVR